jgi:hypothetical protein
MLQAYSLLTCAKARGILQTPLSGVETEPGAITVVMTPVHVAWSDGNQEE